MEQDKTSKPTLISHLLGLLLFPLIGLLVGFIWLWFTTRVLGVGRTGFGNAAAIIVMPIWGLGLGLLVWLPWWFLHNRKWGAMSTGRALLSGAIGSVVISFIMMGPNGFTTRGGAVLMAYALIAIFMIGGWLHNSIVERARART